MPSYEAWAMAECVRRELAPHSPPAPHVWVMDEKNPGRMVLNLSRADFILICQALLDPVEFEEDPARSARLDVIFQDLDEAAFSINPNYAKEVLGDAG